MKISLAVLVMISLLTLGACSPGADSDLKEGAWRGVLTVPGGDLPFGLEFAREEGRWVATLINGVDRIRVSEVLLQGDSITLRMPGYENRIEAQREGDRLTGRLLMIKAKGVVQEIPFSAQWGQDWRFAAPATDADLARAATPADVSGRWAVTFVDGEKSTPAIGEFTQQQGQVTGTFLTPTGDHRFLAGEWLGDELALSKFDGGHVFLYRAKLDTDGRLQGRFWSGTAHQESFSAVRDANASLGDAADMTRWLTANERLSFRFPDVGGSNISINDPFFRGKVVIVALAGSWCPNCHDEAAFLAELHQRLRPQGLEVISLMFEQFGDFPQAAEAVYRFRDRYRIKYATLIAGISDKDDAASKLPQLSGVYAFPTTIFVDRAGMVRKIHTGFSGPATGVHYEKLVAEFERITAELLAEPRPI